MSVWKNRGVFAARIALFLFAMLGIGEAGKALTIQQSVLDLGSNNYQYSFFFNGSVLQNQEVALFFPYYDNVTSGTVSIFDDVTLIYPNANWTSTVIQPDPLLPDNGIWSLVSQLDQPTVLGTFQIRINWAGTVPPDVLAWTLSDTDGQGSILGVVDQGTTSNVPEPASGMLVLGAVGFMLYRRRAA